MRLNLRREDCEHAIREGQQILLKQTKTIFVIGSSGLIGAEVVTGPNHSGVELHGFLRDLVKCNMEEREYTVFGYKVKQVRDNIHSEDVARFIHSFYQAPRSGEVYNPGGGKSNSCSIQEAFSLVEELSGRKQRYCYVDQNRLGDHICYYSDLTKIKAHYPQWDITKSLRMTVAEIVVSWRDRLSRCHT